MSGMAAKAFSMSFWIRVEGRVDLLVLLKPLKYAFVFAVKYA